MQVWGDHIKRSFTWCENSLKISLKNLKISLSSCKSWMLSGNNLEAFDRQHRDFPVRHVTNLGNADVYFYCVWPRMLLQIQSNNFFVKQETWLLLGLGVYCFHDWPMDSFSVCFIHQSLPKSLYSRLSYPAVASPPLPEQEEQIFVSKAPEKTAPPLRSPKPQRVTPKERPVFTKVSPFVL